MSLEILTKINIKRISDLKNEVLFNKIILIRNKYGVHKYTYFGNGEISIKKIL